MKKILFTLFLFFRISSLSAEDFDINTLLQDYKKESSLAKQTKKDTSGLLYLYTREMLEKMQARTLKDILKTLPGFNLYRVGNMLTITPSGNMPFFATSIRIFVNDHDMTSSFRGSSYLLWSDVDLDYIDHIEVYKGTSSIAFGSESAPIVIKLYTKNANREIGSKARLLFDTRGSLHTSLYNAQRISNDFAYFAYGHIDNINNKKYYKYANNQSYQYSSDKKTYNFYANFIYKKTTLELGAIKSKEDAFVGYGIQATPEVAYVNKEQLYFHLTQKLAQDFRVQLSLDHITHTLNTIDKSGVFIVDAPPTTIFNPKNDDDVYSITVDKTLKSQKNRLTVGAFYKYKEFEFTKYNHALVANALYYSSIYAEDVYLLTENIKFVGSLRYNNLQYKKEIQKEKQFFYKTGVNYKDRSWDIQLLYTHSYLTVPFIDYYNPFRASNVAKDLHTPTADIYLTSVKYHFINKDDLSLSIGKRNIKDPIIYNPQLGGFLNLNGYTGRYTFAELTYLHHFNQKNKFDITFYDTYNYTEKLFSPKWGINTRVFNSYKKFDIYNELIYKSSYKDVVTQSHLKASYDWTAAVKYHVTKDFSLGLKGENILNKGLKQAYKNTPSSYPLIEQKFWLNMEYLF